MSRFGDYLDETEQEEETRRPLGVEMQCRNCIFWSLKEWKREKELLDPEGDFAEIWGECRRNAPTPINGVLTKIGDLLGMIAWAVETTANIEHNKFSPYDFEGDKDQGTHEQIWFWPRTQPYSWCGEFKAGRQPMSEANIAKFEKMHEEWRGTPSTLGKNESTPSDTNEEVTE